MLASLEIADSWQARARGLLGRRSFDGALLIEPTRSVHTVGMRFAIDVAFCDRDLTVVAVKRLVPYRVALPVRGTRAVIEAEAGSFDRWGLDVGTELEVRR